MSKNSLIIAGSLAAAISSGCGGSGGGDGEGEVQNNGTQNTLTTPQKDLAFLVHGSTLTGGSFDIRDAISKKIYATVNDKDDGVEDGIIHFSVPQGVDVIAELSPDSIMYNTVTQQRTNIYRALDINENYNGVETMDALTTLAYSIGSANETSSEESELDVLSTLKIPGESFENAKKTEFQALDNESHKLDSLVSIIAAGTNMSTRDINHHIAVFVSNNPGLSLFDEHVLEDFLSLLSIDTVTRIGIYKVLADTSMLTNSNQHEKKKARAIVEQVLEKKKREEYTEDDTRAILLSHNLQNAQLKNKSVDTYVQNISREEAQTSMKNISEHYQEKEGKDIYSSSAGESISLSQKAISNNILNIFSDTDITLRETNNNTPFLRPGDNFMHEIQIRAPKGSILNISSTIPGVRIGLSMNNASYDLPHTFQEEFHDYAYLHIIVDKNVSLPSNTRLKMPISFNAILSNYTSTKRDILNVTSHIVFPGYESQTLEQNSLSSAQENFVCVNTQPTIEEDIKSQNAFHRLSTMSSSDQYTYARIGKVYLDEGKQINISDHMQDFDDYTRYIQTLKSEGYVNKEKIAITPGAIQTFETGKEWGKLHVDTIEILAETFGLNPEEIQYAEYLMNEFERQKTLQGIGIGDVEGFKMPVSKFWYKNDSKYIARERLKGGLKTLANGLIISTNVQSKMGSYLFYYIGLQDKESLNESNDFNILIENKVLESIWLNSTNDYQEEGKYVTDRGILLAGLAGLIKNIDDIYKSRHDIAKVLKSIKNVERITKIDITNLFIKVHKHFPEFSNASKKTENYIPNALQYNNKNIDIDIRITNMLTKGKIVRNDFAEDMKNMFKEKSFTSEYTEDAWENNTIIIGPLKTPKRIKEKAKSDYDGELGRVSDIVRGSYIADNIDEFYNTFYALNKKYGDDIVKVKDTITKGSASGYRDIKLIIKKDDFYTELQLHLRKMYQVKHADTEPYEERRTLKADIDELLKENKSSTDLQRMQNQYNEDTQEALDAFEEAWIKTIFEKK
jgi:hypothetical protein